MNKEGLKFLLEKYFSNSISIKECKMLLADLSQASRDVSDALDELLYNAVEADGPTLNTEKAETIFERIIADPRRKH